MEQRSPRLRWLVVWVLAVVWMVAVLARVSYLQLFCYSEYFARAQRQDPDHQPAETRAALLHGLRPTPPET